MAGWRPAALRILTGNAYGTCRSGTAQSGSEFAMPSSQWRGRPGQAGVWMRPGKRRLLLDWAPRPALWLVGVLAACALSGYLLNPAAQAAQAAGGHAKKGTPFNGTPAVGALFSVVNGKLVAHFCTATVVHSKAQNLLITAAHCVYGSQQPPPDSIAFAPGYHSRKFPHRAAHRCGGAGYRRSTAGRDGDRLPGQHGETRHLRCARLGVPHWPASAGVRLWRLYHRHERRPVPGAC